MGRAERRKQEKRDRDAQWRDLPNWERKYIARVQQSGLSHDDLRKEGERGFKQGREAGLEQAMKSCYAGALLAAQEVFGAEHGKLMEFLQCLDDRVLFSLTSEDLIDEAFEKAGVHIHFKSALDRIEEV